MATILPGQFDHGGSQPFGILSTPRHLTLRRVVLPVHRTGAALRDMQMSSHLLDAGATTLAA